MTIAESIGRQLSHLDTQARAIAPHEQRGEVAWVVDRLGRIATAADKLASDARAAIAQLREGGGA